MNPELLLGLPLHDAERIWQAQGGRVPPVRETHDPRTIRTEGTLRLVRVKPDEWTVARFLDGSPRNRIDLEGNKGEQI